MNLMKQLTTFDTNILKPGTCVQVGVKDIRSSFTYRGIIVEASPIALKTEYITIQGNKPVRATDNIILDHVDESGPEKYPATGIVRPRRWITILDVPRLNTPHDMLDYLYNEWEDGMKGVLEDIVAHQGGDKEGLQWVLDTMVKVVGEDFIRNHLPHVLGVPTLSPEEHLSKFIHTRRKEGLAPTEIAQEMVNVMGRTVFTVALEGGE